MHMQIRAFIYRRRRYLRLIKEFRASRCTREFKYARRVPAAVDVIAVVAAVVVVIVIVVVVVVGFVVGFVVVVSRNEIKADGERERGICRFF